MSALDRLMTAASSGITPSDSSKSTLDPSSKVVKRFSELEKRREKSSVANVFLSKEKQQAYTMAPYDFFLENSDCVAMHNHEHPALQEFCKMVGMPPLNRKVSFLPLCNIGY